jgi:coenzyme F420-reducing hydrogenase beta subunit
VINNNEKVRLESSSGGAFSLIAEEIIHQGGVVFGAKFDMNFSVMHGYTETMQGIQDFRRSKYVQSKIGDSYKECRNFLEEGRNVLFSGTPCQISGLKAYLGKNYHTLYCVDLICTGVSSPGVWKRHLEHMETIWMSKVKNVVFRDKYDGDEYVWAPAHDSFLVLQFQNGAEIRVEHEKDPIFRTMLNGINVPICCSKCKYRTLNRLSDITLSDFWGIEKVCPEMHDNKGTSLVLVQSNKGKKLLNHIKNQCRIKSVPTELAVKYNSCAYTQKSYNNYRDIFFKNIDKYPLDVLAKKYHAYGPLSRRLYKLIRRKFKKVKFILNLYNDIGLV